ncbi:MAG: hypothetical protein ACLS8R_05575 [Anaeromassilibacillus sp.]
MFIEIKWLPSEAGKVVSMAEIAPLRALRYTAKAGSLENLVCPPMMYCPGRPETYRRAARTTVCTWKSRIPTRKRRTC